MSSGML